MEQLQEIYCRYTEEATAVKQAASPLAGILGTSGGPSDHPCHQAFYDRVGSWTAEFLAKAPDADSVAEATRFILTAGAAHKDQPTYWFVCAAQSHAKAMIALLSPQTCRELRQEYEDLYPRSSRLPLQQEIYGLLCAGAGETPRKNRFFDFLRK